MDILRSNIAVFTINPQDDSTLVKRVMGDNQLNIHLKVVAPLAFQIGDQVIFEGETFTLNKLPTGKQISTREYEYNCIFEGLEYELLKVIYKLFDSGSGIPPQTDFPLTGNAITFVQLIADNMNEVGSGWTVGEVVDSVHKTLNFDNEDCLAVLTKLAGEFETEFWIAANKTINLTRKELVITPPILEYGQGNGLKEVVRANSDDSNIVTRLYAFGSERNIKSGYRSGSKRLLLPSAAYIEQNVATYGVIEAAMTWDDIYPRLQAGLGPTEPGKVTAINGMLKFSDANMDFDVNAQLLPGITAKVVFLTGQLAGQEFEISNYNNATKEYTFLKNNFEDAGELPVTGIEVAVGDEYVMVDIDMPAAYIARAEAELLAKAQAYMAENSSPRHALTVTCDTLYLKTNDINFTTGQLVHITATPLGIDRDIRVVGFTRNVREVHNYTLELADVVNPSRIDRIETGVDENKKKIVVNAYRDRTYTFRSYRDIQETIAIMYDPDGSYFTDIVKPLMVETAGVIVGTNSQQFDFVGLFFRPNYQGNPNDFRWTAGSLVHNTLEKTWTIASGQTPELTSGTPYYIYAKCSRTLTTGTILQSTVPILLEDDPDYYHFWIGVLNAVVGTSRSWQPRHGFTEIAGQYITTGVIKSADGLTYFDLNAGEIGGRIVFSNGTRTLEQLGSQADDSTDYLDNALQTILTDIYDQLDGVIEQYFETYDPTTANLPAVDWTTTQLKEDHLGDQFFNINTGDGWRWVKDATTYFWQSMSSEDAAAALELANTALNLAGTKRRIFVAQPVTPYEIGDLWVQGTSGDIMRCQTARASGAYVSGDWVKASKYTDDTTVNNLITNLGALAYEDLVETAKLGTTVIEGGYIKTSLINTSALIVAGALETVSGAQSKATEAQSAAIAAAAIDATNKANNAISVSQAYTDTLANGLGSLAYEDLVSIALLDSTVIQGGYIKTALIDTNTLIAKHVLTAASGRRVHIDGTNNRMQFFSANGFESLRIDDAITYDDAGNPTGGMVAKNSNDTRRAYISGSGLFSNAGGFGFFSSASGIYTNASVVGMLFDRNNDSDGISAGVVGLDGTTTGNSNSFGGWFNSLFAGALHVQNRRITSSALVTLNESDCHVSCSNSTSGGLYLPASPKVGQVIFVVRAGAGTVVVYGNGHVIRRLGTDFNNDTISGNSTGSIFVWDGFYWTLLKLIA